MNTAFASDYVSRRVWLRADAVLTILHKYHNLLERAIQYAERQNSAKPLPGTRTLPPPKDKAEPRKDVARNGGPTTQVPRRDGILYEADGRKLADKILPLRTAPDPEAKMVFAIPPGARDIEGLGARAFHIVWWRKVRFQGQTGWVSAWYLEPQ
jgi:hypothetical protein